MALYWRGAPNGLSGDGDAGQSPSLWIVLPMLIAVGSFILFLQWRIWASQRAFTRRANTPNGDVVIRAAPEDVTRPGDAAARALIRTRPGWSRPWFVTVSGPGASDGAHGPAKFTSRREARAHVETLVRAMSTR